MPHNRLPSQASSRHFSRTMLSLIATCSSVGIIQTGWAIAADPAPDASLEMPSAAELLNTAPAPVAPAPVAPPAAAPAPAPAPTVEVIPPAPQPRATAPAESAPAAPIAPTAESSPAIEAATADQITERSQIPLRPSELFIDSTEYSIGATRSPNQPAVVFSERSTGCERTLQAGQSIPSSLCQADPTGATVAAGSGSSGGRSPSGSGAAQAASRNLLDRVVGQTTAASREYFNRGARALNRLRQGEYKFVFPLTVPAPITSAFGWRIHPISGDQRFHAGTDIGAPLGTPIVAARAGQVAASEFMQGYGFTVVMNHIDEANRIAEQTLYAHMAQLLVQPGEWVEQGEVIGLVGSTGNSTGPHLHFELRQLSASGWVLIDPGQLLEYTLAQLMNTLDLADTRLDPALLAKQRAQKVALKAASAPKPMNWADLDIQPGQWVEYTVAQFSNVLQPAPTPLPKVQTGFSLSQVQLPGLQRLRSPKVGTPQSAPTTDIDPAKTEKAPQSAD